MTGRRHSFAIMSISVLIVVVLGMQFVAGLVDTGRWGWPILAYPMYKTAHYDGERLQHDYDLYAVFENGTRVDVGREALGMNFWLFRYGVVGPMLAGQPERLQPVVEHVCSRELLHLTRLEVYDPGVAIGRDGPVYGLEPELLATVDVRCD